MPEQAGVTRVVIADDHPVLREGLRGLLNAQPDIEVVGEASDGIDAIRVVRETAPDLLLLDLAMPRLGGLDVLRELRGGSTRVLVFAAEANRDTTLSALRLGARGVLLKDCHPSLLFKCIRCVMAGEHWIGREVIGDIVKTLAGLELPAEDAGQRFGLTARERDVIKLVAAGLANREIAETFNVSTDTVKHHLTNIFDKTGMSTRLELAIFATSHKLV